MKSKILLLSIILLPSFMPSLRAEENVFLEFQDYIIYIEGVELILGSHLPTLLKALEKTQGEPTILPDIGWNCSAYQFEKFRIIYLNDGPEPGKEFNSIMISSPGIETHRGIGVGDSRSAVLEAYPVINDEKNSFYSSSDFIAYERIFFRDEASELNTLESFYGEATKTLCISFDFDEADLVERIFVNVGFID